MNKDLDNVINDEWATCDKTPGVSSIRLWTGEYKEERIKEYIVRPVIANLQKFLMNILILLNQAQYYNNKFIVTFIEFIFLIPITCFDNTIHFNKILNHPNNLFTLSNTIWRAGAPATELLILKKIYNHITDKIRKFDVAGYKTPEICYTFTNKPTNM